MKFDIEIPKQLSHLKIDERGYPIPYFAPVRDGKPIFRLADHRKIKNCIKHKLCGICGKHLPSGDTYIISGPVGLQNGVSSDAMMHLVCAKFTLVACPHIFYKKAERKEETSSVMVPGKPDEYFLIKVKKWGAFWTKTQVKNAAGHLVTEDIQLFGFKPESWKKYKYIDNVLVEDPGT